MPAFASTAFSGTPRHFALPMAPLPSWPPATRGSKKPRLLPEHWFTATTRAGVNLVLRSSMLSSRGWSTRPCTLRRHVARSTLVGTGKMW